MKEVDVGVVVAARGDGNQERGEMEGEKWVGGRLGLKLGLGLGD